MKVLVGFECSQIVTKAFLDRGHDAMSCDLKAGEQGLPHYQGDFFDIASNEWDLIIAHPPCTYLAVSGNRWYAGTKKRAQAVQFVERIWDLPVKKLCIENPVGVLTTQSKLPSPQYVQPWQFGHGEMKKTALYLRGLPPLISTDIVTGREQRIWKMPPSEERQALRSRTYQGIAEAMATQWGSDE